MTRLRVPGRSVVDVWDVELARAGRALPVTHLLARYLGRTPEIVHSEHGKPHLRDGDGLTFSVTHSAGRGLIAVTSERAVGVDLEAIRPRPRAERLASRWLSADERAWLDARPLEERLAAFHRVWTLKEACVKASGLGLQRLAGTDVRPGATRSWSETADERWAVRSLDVGDGWAAAVAVAVEDGRPRPRIRLRRVEL